MDRRCIVLAIMLLLVVIGAGCLTTTGGSEEPLSTISLNIQDNRTPSGHHITGEIFLQFLDTEQAFEEVTVCVYTDEGTQLTSQVVGDVEPIEEATFVINTDNRPKYLIVDHPRFRNYDTGVGLIEWRDEYRRDVGAIPEDFINEFEYVPPAEAGECGATQPAEG